MAEADRPVLVVTGASYGLGAEVARHFARSFQVCALARSGEGLQRLAEEAAAAAAAATGGSDGGLPPIATFTCDVSCKEAVQSTCKAILERFGRIDVLVNNAAVFEVKPLHELTLDSIDSMIDVNLKGTIYVTHSFLPTMISQKRGKIVMVNSVAGLPTWTIPGETAYCASKHGQSGFASALANEVREHGITVTSIHPGGIDTPLQANAGTPPEIRAQFLTCEDVVESIDYIVQADPKVLVKRLELFRAGFWH